MPEVQSSDMHFSEDVPVPSPEQVKKKQLSHKDTNPPVEMSGEAAPDRAVTPLERVLKRVLAC